MSRPYYEVLLRNPSPGEGRHAGLSGGEAGSGTVHLPKKCVICSKPAAGPQVVTLDSATMGPGHDTTIRFSMPYCPEHLETFKREGAFPGSAATGFRTTSVLTVIMYVFIGILVAALLLLFASWELEGTLSLESWRPALIIVAIIFGVLAIALAMAGNRFNIWRLSKWMAKTPEGREAIQTSKDWQKLGSAVQARYKADGSLSLRFSNKDFADEFRKMNSDLVLRSK